MKIDEFFDHIEAAVSSILGDHERAALYRGDLDESRERGGAFQHGTQWLWPLGEDYRIVKYQDGRLGLQSLFNGEWACLREYDNGRDEYGRLDRARWRKIAHTCMYRESDLRLMRERLLGIHREPQVIE